MFDTVSFDAVFAGAPGMVDAELTFLGHSFDFLEVACILLFVGAMGKSAQFLLHTWLPDAMEGPTPVSALIHAATMVTAGVFMVARLSPIFEYAPIALSVVTFFGATTAIFAATIAITQNDIKRVIAYSTCSQLGYMFFACGVSAYGAGIFHLTTHAFFKALLFLGAGAVIHAMSDEQDMRKMGGIWRMIPVTYVLMWIGNLALAGIFPFSGFFSKDIILESAFASHTGLGMYAFGLGILAAFLTAFYSWRLLFLTFHGKPRADEKVMAHVHEAPPVMWVPLVGLAIGAIVIGYLMLPMVATDIDFWGTSILVLPIHNALEEAHHVDFWVKALPMAVGVLGIAGAFLFYVLKPELPAGSPPARGLSTSSCSTSVLRRALRHPLRALRQVSRAQPLEAGDGAVIDGIGPDGIAAATLSVARRAVKLQSGYVYHYAFAMLLGLAAIVTWYLIAGR